MRPTHLLPFPRNCGFTLIEMLVVMSLISLLVAILLPALATARESSKTAVCLSNLKQIGIGPAMYAADNKGWLPDGNGINTNGWGKEEPVWARVLAKTLDIRYHADQIGAAWFDATLPAPQEDGLHNKAKDNLIFQCPTERPLYNNKNGGDNATSYAHNSGTINDTTYLGLGNSDAYFIDTVVNVKLTGRPVRDDEVVYMSRVMFVGETDKLTTDPNWLEDGTGCWFKFGAAVANRYPGGSWHQNTGNYLFLDGRAQTLAPSALNVKMFDRRK